MLNTLNAAIPEWLKRTTAFTEAVAQHETDVETRRAAALAGLAEVEGEWTATIPPLQQTLDDATDAVRKAREAVQVAQRRQLAAQNELNAARYALDRRRDGLRHELETELADPRIVAALAQLDQVEAATREAQPADTDRHVYTSIRNRLGHIRDVARPELAALKFQRVDDVSKAIGKLFAAIPAIEQT